ncbi:hypothetical protein [Nonomuraea sp. B19D2]|uniref:hypothetical protein n=1 Tax=Nonomuraea sp. B19D2 TaxID=3159561 RepID=UPI0032DB6EA3
MRRSVRAEIQANEEHLLTRLPEADRHGFLRALQALYQLPRERITEKSPLDRRPAQRSTTAHER